MMRQIYNKVPYFKLYSYIWVCPVQLHHVMNVSELVVTLHNLDAQGQRTLKGNHLE